jgi:hypothetical protein
MVYLCSDRQSGRGQWSGEKGAQFNPAVGARHRKELIIKSSMPEKQPPFSQSFVGAIIVTAVGTALGTLVIISMNSDRPPKPDVTQTKVTTPETVQLPAPSPNRVVVPPESQDDVDKQSKSSRDSKRSSPAPRTVPTEECRLAARFKSFGVKVVASAHNCADTVCHHTTVLDRVQLANDACVIEFGDSPRVRGGMMLGGKASPSCPPVTLRRANSCSMVNAVRMIGFTAQREGKPCPD